MLKKHFILFLLFLMTLGSTAAQSFLSNPSSAPSMDPLNFAGDTLRILGIMVNFQEDRDASTFGNGKFGSIYSQNYGNTILDPLPHDKAYFEAHLEFVKNYYERVSSGRLLIEYYIFPDTFSVSMTMRNYSPPPNSDDFSLIGQFASEVWTIADSLYPRFDFSNFDLFTIFHAGVGRDITLPGSLGNERDLPSVYLGLNSLRKIYGNSFEGFELANNNFRIPNTMIIPETESRELTSLGSTFLFQITINGLLTANVASHLGLPDLFDTNTGLSAIGRFGLMDGQSIFAYNGLFPPEPSAWEKMYLGWAEPVTLLPGNYDVNLVASMAASISDTVILKIPINSTEYFLVENRNRDTRNDGAALTYLLDGEIRTKVFTKDTTGFYSYSVDSVRGVVLNVDEFDWALPGNGILIWHIDDNIINQKISENKINTDKFFRGVDVEEADGVQDIGERFITIFGDVVIGEGTADDLWYAGNPSRLYTNRFSKNTRPDSKTNSGANSLISIFDFSEISNRMSFKVSYGDSIVKPIFSRQSFFLSPENNSLTVTSHEGIPSFNILADSVLYHLSDSGLVSTVTSLRSNFKPAAVVLGGVEYLAGVDFDNNIRIFADGYSVLNPITVNGKITAPPVIRKTLTEQYDLLIGTSVGKVYIYSMSQLPFSEPVLTDSMVIDPRYSILRITTDNLFISLIGSNDDLSSPDRFRYFDNEGNSHILFINGINGCALIRNREGINNTVVLSDDNSFYVIPVSGMIRNFSFDSDEIISSFSIADIKQDGSSYIIFTLNDLYAVNLNGVSADNFPFKDPANVGFEGLPLAADFEGDGKSEIIAYTKDGRIFAVDGGSTGIINGFPVSAGGRLISEPAIFNYRGMASLAVIDESSRFYAWTIGLTAGTFYWTQEYADSRNSSGGVPAASLNYISEYLPKNRAYNYPNPVYDGITYIRYYVSERSIINIKIFDLAGDFVAELKDDAIGGVDNETEWNVGNIQSGVYLARVEASSASGKSESAIIKIAVVK